ncbi:hypothetical protein [Sorangium sp. So ce233]|uniref:hypothetical protein n=1 Tax=Sorangium sp. So ce233 TaxID=3133290 RepID=UPI003F6339E1
MSVTGFVALAAEAIEVVGVAVIVVSLPAALVVAYRRIGPERRAPRSHAELRAQICMRSSRALMSQGIAASQVRVAAVVHSTIR